MSGDVTFLEDTPYFSSSLDECQPVLEMLPVPYFDPSFFPLQKPNNSPIKSNEDAPSNSPPQSQPPLITYQRQVQAADPTVDEAEQPDDSCSTPSATSTTDLPEPNSDLTVALRKGTRSTCNSHPT